MKSKVLLSLVLAATIMSVSPTAQAQTYDELLAGAQEETDVWNFDEALVLYDQALALDQSDARTFFMRGVARRETGDTDGALEDFAQAIAMSPDEPEYLYESGLLRVYVQDYEGAVAGLDRLLALEPTQTVALLQRAQVKERSGDHAGAQADFQEAQERGHDPESR